MDAGNQTSALGKSSKLSQPLSHLSSYYLWKHQVYHTVNLNILWSCLCSVTDLFAYLCAGKIFIFEKIFLEDSNLLAGESSCETQRINYRISISWNTLQILEARWSSPPEKSHVNACKKADSFTVSMPTTCLVFETVIKCKEQLILTESSILPCSLT